MSAFCNTLPVGCLKFCFSLEIRCSIWPFTISFQDRIADIVIRTPFGNTSPFTTNSLVKQGTSLVPILINCSLDEMCAHSNSYQYGTVAIKSLEFVDDIADADNGSSQVLASHKIIADIIERKRLKLSIDKCKLLRINGGKSDVNSLTVYGEQMKVEETSKYLGDTLTPK